MTLFVVVEEGQGGGKLRAAGREDEHVVLFRKLIERSVKIRDVRPLRALHRRSLAPERGEQGSSRALEAFEHARIVSDDILFLFQAEKPIQFEGAAQASRKSLLWPRCAPMSSLARRCW